MAGIVGVLMIFVVVVMLFTLVGLLILYPLGAVYAAAFFLFVRILWKRTK